MASTDRTVVASNRKARHEYEVLDVFEAGLVLQGSEVKSLRTAKAQIAESYAYLKGTEVFLKGMHIAPYLHGHGRDGHDPERERKLLLHRNEIDEIADRIQRERLSLVPLSLYFVGSHAKIELGLAKGRKRQDKRQAIAERDARRDVERAFAERQRGPRR